MTSIPLSDQTTLRALPHNRPSLLEGRTRFTLLPGPRPPAGARLGQPQEHLVRPAWPGLHVPAAGCEGVVMCQGGNMAGWSLYVVDGVPVYHYNLYGRELTTITGTAPLPAGEVALGVSFSYDGGGLGKGGELRLSVDGEAVARGRIERTVPFLFSMSGETLDVGVDTGAPAGPYPPRFPFTGGIDRIEIELQPALTAAQRGEEQDGQARGALASQ